METDFIEQSHIVVKTNSLPSPTHPHFTLLSVRRRYLDSDEAVVTFLLCVINL